MKKTIICFLLLIVSLAACAPRSDETTPEMAQSMLKMRGYNFNETDFFKAIRAADAQAVRAFLQAGMNPNAKNEKGETALTFAVQYSELPVVKVLIEKADINLPDGVGNAPLFVALKQKKDEIFDYLLDHEADVNSVGTAGNTKNQSVLWVAVLQEKTDIIQKLLDKGADPNLADSGDAIPISEVALRARPDLDVFKMLLDKGSNVNHQEKNGATVLIYAAKNRSAPADTQRIMVKTLLARGADKSIKDKEGMTALDWAKKNNNVDAAEALK